MRSVRLRSGTLGQRRGQCLSCILVCVFGVFGYCWSNVDLCLLLWPKVNYCVFLAILQPKAAVAFLKCNYNNVLL